MATRTLLLALAVLAAGRVPAFAACPQGSGLTTIPAVQGAGARSPLTGRSVRVQGVVSAAFPGANGLGDFFLQDASGDGDPATSDALFVELRAGADTPRPGDAVQVTGTVVETDGMTQLASVSRLERCGREAVPAPREVRLPVAGASTWEALEGMLVHVQGPLVITDVYELGRYGELSLADGRLFAPTQGVADQGSIGLRRLVLDDGSLRQDPRPVPYLMDDGRPPRVGDGIRDVTAVVMASGPASYRLEPVSVPQLLPTNPRPEAPAAVGGDVRVATFNVHNFFTTLGERGARSTREYDLQRAKLVSALAGLDTDAIALQEVENDGMRSENALLQALNTYLGGSEYAAVPDPASGVGHDRIKQAILYRPSRLELIATASDPRPVFERPPVAATFRRKDGGTFTLLAVHLKSKGGCPSAGDVDRGYGCWNLRRSAQAQEVLAFAARLGRSAGDPDVLVAGDLNSYAAEPPVRLFTAAGYRNAGRTVPAPERYSYVYAGLSGTLDYLMASPSLARQLTGATFWHIDADESPLVDADTRYDPPGFARPDAFRASDHDPVLVGIRLAAGDGADAPAGR